MATADPAPTTSPSPQISSQDIQLISMPLVLTMPDDWKLKPRDQPEYLEGPAPDGDVVISLSVLDGMSDNSQRLYVDAAMEQGQKHPRKIQIHQSATNGGMQVLERITYPNLPDGPVDQDRPATRPSEPLAWSLVVFVPFQHKFIPCRFDLMKLTQQQYTDDEQFVESMIDSARPGNFSAFK